MYIGFNLKEASKLTDEITKKFKIVEQLVESNWSPLKQTLRNNWVGPDEQDFELELVNRINSLYSKAYDLVKKCNENVVKAANSWDAFQEKNTIDGGRATSGLSFGAAVTSSGLGDWLASLGIKKDKIVSFNSYVISANTSRGLTSSNSGTVLMNSVDTFVKNVQSKCNSLFDTVSTKKAFFGQQSAVVDSYLKEVAKSIGVLMTSVKDLQEHLYRLTGNNYSRKDFEVQMDFTPANVTIDKIFEQGPMVTPVNPTNRWGISSN